MNSTTYRKNTLQSLNAHTIISLISLFFTGIALIFIGFLFSLNLLELSYEIRVNLRLFNGLTIIIIILGLILILLAAIQSISLLKKIKKVIDAILSGEVVVQTGEEFTESGIKPSSGIGGGLTIIRPPMTEREEAPISKSGRAPAKVKAKAKVLPSIQQPKEEIIKEPTAVAATPITEKVEMAKEEGVDVTLEEALQKIVDRYNDPKVAKSFQKWDEILMMTFPDVNKSYLYKINKDEVIKLMEGYDEEAAVQVKLNSNIFIKMMTKQINPIKAYSSGELEVAGKMRDLLKLRKLMF